MFAHHYNLFIIIITRSTQAPVRAGLFRRPTYRRTFGHQTGVVNM